MFEKASTAQRPSVNLHMCYCVPPCKLISFSHFEFFFKLKKKRLQNKTLTFAFKPQNPRFASLFKHVLTRRIDVACKLTPSTPTPTLCAHMEPSTRIPPFLSWPGSSVHVGPEKDYHKGYNVQMCARSLSIKGCSHTETHRYLHFNNKKLSCVNICASSSNHACVNNTVPGDTLTPRPVALSFSVKFTTHFPIYASYRDMTGLSS